MGKNVDLTQNLKSVKKLAIGNNLFKLCMSLALSISTYFLLQIIFLAFGQINLKFDCFYFYFQYLFVLLVKC